MQKKKALYLVHFFVLEAIGACPNGQFPSPGAIWAIYAPPMGAAGLLEWGWGGIRGPTWPGHRVWGTGQRGSQGIPRDLQDILPPSTLQS